MDAPATPVLRGKNAEEEPLLETTCHGSDTYGCFSASQPSLLSTQTTLEVNLIKWRCSWHSRWIGVMELQNRHGSTKHWTVFTILERVLALWPLAYSLRTEGEGHCLSWASSAWLQLSWLNSCTSRWSVLAAQSQASLVEYHLWQQAE